jgi:TPP-dependent pyruvate/acetoin dehydrogenase alpha subunit
VERIDRSVRAEIQRARDFALASPEPDPSTQADFVYA